MPALIAFFFLILLGSPPALADSASLCRASPTHHDASEAAENEEDQDRAREALKRRQIRPLAEILRVAKKAVPGEVVSVKLECKDQTWFYEIKIVTRDNRRHDLYVNAATLSVKRDD